MPWAWAAAAAGLALLLGATTFLLVRRRRRALPRLEDRRASPSRPLDRATPEAAEPSGQVAAPAFWAPSRPVERIEAAVQAPPKPRPILVVEAEIARAGLNLLSAAAELDVTVRNTARVPARDVAIFATLLSAQGDQETQIAGLFAGARGRPDIPLFSLEPGEARSLRLTPTLPRPEIRQPPGIEHPVFLPVLALDVRYLLTDGTAAQTASAWVFGLRRQHSQKLAPFKLDVAPQMRRDIAVRPPFLKIET